jgi:hypothetical protein
VLYVGALFLHCSNNFVTDYEVRFHLETAVIPMKIRALDEDVRLLLPELQIALTYAET